MTRLPWQILMPVIPLICLFFLGACTSVKDDGSPTAADPGAVPEPSPTMASAQSATRIPGDAYADLEIVTLLPRDAIPAVDNPQFLAVSEADTYYDPDELVLGVEFSGDARAYSVPFLSSHEIVNDTVGGVKIAVTW